MGSKFPTPPPANVSKPLISPPPPPKKVTVSGIRLSLDEISYLQIRRGGKLITIQDEDSQPVVKGFADGR